MVECICTLFSDFPHHVWKMHCYWIPLDPHWILVDPNASLEPLHRFTAALLHLNRQQVSFSVIWSHSVSLHHPFVFIWVPMRFRQFGVTPYHSLWCLLILYSVHMFVQCGCSVLNNVNCSAEFRVGFIIKSYPCQIFWFSIALHGQSLAAV